MKLRRTSDLEKAMRNASASPEVEGLTVPEGGEELIRKKLRGEISHSEFLKQAAEVARNVRTTVEV